MAKGIEVVIVPSSALGRSYENSESATIVDVFELEVSSDLPVLMTVLLPLLIDISDTRRLYAFGGLRERLETIRSEICRSMP